MAVVVAAVFAVAVVEVEMMVEVVEVLLLLPFLLIHMSMKSLMFIRPAVLGSKNANVGHQHANSLIKLFHTCYAHRHH